MRLLAIILPIFILSGCKKDLPPERPKNNVPEIQPKGGVFIINEGNFQWGNASVSYYNYADSSISHELFKTANNRPLGDVFQSMEIFNGNAYLVLDNSGKIEVANPIDFKSTGTISGLTSPRYFLGINNSKAYVSDFKANAISVINLNTNTVSKRISCPGWTEELALVGNKVFATNIYREYVYVIDTSTDAIEDSIHVNYGPSSIRKDKNGKLWVLSSGKSAENIKSALYRINPADNNIELTLEFPANEKGSRLRINDNKDVLYYLNQGVCKMPITQTSLPSAKLIPMGEHIFYGLGIEPVTEHIYVADAIDYVQRGIVLRYKTNGSLIDSFRAGIIPSGFYFYQ